MTGATYSALLPSGLPDRVRLSFDPLNCVWANGAERGTRASKRLRLASDDTPVAGAGASSSAAAAAPATASPKVSRPLRKAIAAARMDEADDEKEVDVEGVEEAEADKAGAVEKVTKEMPWLTVRLAPLGRRASHTPCLNGAVSNLQKRLSCPCACAWCRQGCVSAACATTCALGL